MPENIPRKAIQATRESERLPSDEREGQIFWKLRWRTGQAQLKFMLRHARLRTAIVMGLSLLFWLGLFILFFKGFDFVVEYVGEPGATYHAQTIRFVFTLFFVSLQVMLIFSAGIILYGGLYATREVQFLMTLPVRNSRLVFYRYQEALFFSSWGFFLLASPMVFAYGVVVSAPWYYFAYLPMLIISFAYISCGVGAIACLVVVSRLPHLRRAVVGLLAAVVIGAAYYSISQSLNIKNADLLGAEWFQQTYHRFEFTRGEWLPSTWLSNGLLESARQKSPDPEDLPWLQGGKYLILMVSNALFLHVMVLWLGGRVFRGSYFGLNTRQARATKSRMVWIDRIALFFLKPFSKEIRLLMIKDLRMFRRDPVQWAQFLIFFGLLMLYFANVDRFRQHQIDVNAVTWVNIVSFLNLAVVGLILSTFTTRFIYPLISLEGSRFWILGRLPVNRDTILWGKFLFAACGSLLPCCGLVLLSDLVLEVDLLVLVVHQLICLLLCLGLSGMAVGMGAMMPNFREQSPSKIAAGFGGTLNLVLSALYIMAIVLLTALPCHYYLLSQVSEVQTRFLQPGYLKLWLMLGVGGSLVLAVLVTTIPMAKGLKAFRELEV